MIIIIISIVTIFIRDSRLKDKHYNHIIMMIIIITVNIIIVIFIYYLIMYRILIFLVLITCKMFTRLSTNQDPQVSEGYVGFMFRIFLIFNRENRKFTPFFTEVS